MNFYYKNNKEQKTSDGYFLATGSYKFANLFCNNNDDSK